MDLTLVLTDKDGYYTVEDQLIVPEHSRLEVYASDYVHTSIRSSGDGVEEDSTRCPTKIHLLEHAIINRGDGDGEGGWSDTLPSNKDHPYNGLSLYVTKAASRALPLKNATSANTTFAF